MAKSQKHLRQIVENTSEIGYHPFERDIPLNKTYRIFSKQSLKYSDLETSETESSMEINFLIGKIKHTVRRVKRHNDADYTEVE